MLVREGQAQTRLKLLAGKTLTNLYDLNEMNYQTFYNVELMM